MGILVSFWVAVDGDLSNGIWIIEGLNLSGVKAGDYDLVCLPLRLERGDGAPARVILKPLKA